MKKIFYSLLFICFSISCFAQTTNSSFPIGRYKFAISDASINFSVGENNRWALVMEEKKRSYDDYEWNKEYLRATGSYELKQDTLFLTPDENNMSAYAVQHKKSSDVEQGKVRVKLENFSYYEEVSIQIGNQYAVGKGETIDKIFENLLRDYDDEVIYTSMQGGDSLYISESNYYETSVFAYPIPQKSNDLIIKKDKTKGIPFLFKAHKGENSNELMVYLDENGNSESFSLFFVENKVDKSLMQSGALTPVAGFEFIHNPPRIFKLESSYYLEPNYEDFNEDARLTTTSSMATYNSYKDALKAAKNDNKYILLYYEPANSKCDYTLNEYKMYLENYGKTDGFNHFFVFYQVKENNKDLLKTHNISTRPAIVILNTDEEVIYTASDKCIFSSPFTTLLYNDIQLFKTGVNLQYINNVLAPKMNNAKIDDKKQLEKYLQTIVDIPDTYLNDVSYYFNDTWDDSKSPEWNVDFNHEDASKYLNRLISGLYNKEKVTPERISLVKNILDLINRKYPIIYNNQLSPAYTYLAKAYENGSHTENNSELFRFIVGGILYEEDGIENLCLQIIDAAPSTKELLMPFVVYCLDMNTGEYDDLDKNVVASISDYLDNFIGSNSKKTTDIYNKLHADQYKELAYVLSLFGYTCVGEDNEEKEVLLDSYLDLLGSNLNTIAWLYYEYVGIDKPELLQKALNWSKTSLSIDPVNPYYLDTYAHLLYQLGRKQEAIEYQEKAVENIDQVVTASQKRTMRNALIRMKKDTHW
jgi:hypothetical protein